jgi:hypothetical protein
MNEFFYGYVETMKVLNELFVEASQNFIRINEQYRDLFKANGDIDTLYNEYIDYIQKLNKQWVESFFGPSLVKALIQHKKGTEATQDKKGE